MNFQISNQTKHRQVREPQSPNNFKYTLQILVISRLCFPWRAGSWPLAGMPLDSPGLSRLLAVHSPDRALPPRHQSWKGVAVNVLYNYICALKIVFLFITRNNIEPSHCCNLDQIYGTILAHVKSKQLATMRSRIS